MSVLWVETHPSYLVSGIGYSDSMLSLNPGIAHEREQSSNLLGNKKQTYWRFPFSDMRTACLTRASRFVTNPKTNYYGGKISPYFWRLFY